MVGSLRPSRNGTDGPDRPPLAVNAINWRTSADWIGGVAAGQGFASGRTGVSLYRDAVFPVPPIHEAHMGDALEVGIVDAENVSRSRGGLRTVHR